MDFTVWNAEERKALGDQISAVSPRAAAEVYAKDYTKSDAEVVTVGVVITVLVESEEGYMDGFGVSVMGEPAKCFMVQRPGLVTAYRNGLTKVEVT